MRVLCIVFVIGLLGCASSSPRQVGRDGRSTTPPVRYPQPPRVKPELRVATYNIFAGKLGIPAVAQELSSLEADVIGLQEVDRGTRRSGGVDVLQQLAKRLDLYSAFASAMDFDGGQYGVALLSRSPLSQVRVVRLPAPLGAEPRVLLMASTEIRGVTWTVATTHLSSHLDGHPLEQVHSKQNRVVAETLGGRPRTLLLADLNTEANASSMIPLTMVGSLAGLEEGPTYPADSPQKRIDHILYSQDLVGLESQVVCGKASDHCALVTQVARRLVE